VDDQALRKFLETLREAIRIYPFKLMALIQYIIDIHLKRPAVQ